MGDHGFNLMVLNLQLPIGNPGPISTKWPLLLIQRFHHYAIVLLIVRVARVVNFEKVVSVIPVKESFLMSCNICFENNPALHIWFLNCLQKFCLFLLLTKRFWNHYPDYIFYSCFIWYDCFEEVRYFMQSRSELYYFINEWKDQNGHNPRKSPVFSFLFPVFISMYFL